MKKRSAAIILVGLLLAVGFSQQFFPKDDIYLNAEDICWSPYPSADLEEEYTSDPGDCKCFDGMGSAKGDLPKIAWINGELKLIACGFVDSRENVSEATMTEFSIFDGVSGEVLFMADSLTYYKVVSTKQGIEIRRVAYLPIEEGGLEEVVVSTQLVAYVDGVPSVGHEEILLADFNVNEERMLALRNKVESVISGDVPPSWQELVNECLVCSIGGDAYARDLLINFENRFQIELAGSDAQVYNDCLELLDLVEENSSANELS